MRWERTYKFEQMSACYLLAHEITTVLTTQRHISKLTATKTRRNYELAFAQHNPCTALGRNRIAPNSWDRPPSVPSMVLGWEKAHLLRWREVAVSQNGTVVHPWRHSHKYASTQYVESFNEIVHASSTLLISGAFKSITLWTKTHYTTCNDVNINIQIFIDVYIKTETRPFHGII